MILMALLFAPTVPSAPIPQNLHWTVPASVIVPLFKLENCLFHGYGYAAEADGSIGKEYDHYSTVTKMVSKDQKTVESFVLFIWK
jgi:hypothetical protein